MPYNAIISRTEAEGLIPTEVAGDVIKAAIQSSAALALSRRATMSSKLQRQPVLSVLPQAYWVAGDTGLKMPSDAAFEGLELNAEEIAVLIPIPEAVLDDASYDEWGELRDPIAQAIGVKLDAAIFSGTEKPASWPEAIVPAAILAANVNTIDATAAEGGVYTDIVETGDAVENDGYEVTGYVVKRAPLATEPDARHDRAAALRRVQRLDRWPACRLRARRDAARNRARSPDSGTCP